MILLPENHHHYELYFADSLVQHLTRMMEHYDGAAAVRFSCFAYICQISHVLSFPLTMDQNQGEWFFFMIAYKLQT